MTATTTTAREPKECARPGCANQFTPAHAAHKYCSTLCKKRVYGYAHALRMQVR